jgi:hypothetical protein
MGAACSAVSAATEPRAAGGGGLAPAHTVPGLSAQQAYAWLSATPWPDPRRSIVVASDSLTDANSELTAAKALLTAPLAEATYSAVHRPLPRQKDQVLVCGTVSSELLAELRATNGMVLCCSPDVSLSELVRMYPWLGEPASSVVDLPAEIVAGV